MKKQFSIRPITLQDAVAALEVYKPYVLETANTFEYDVPSKENFTERIINTTEQYPWLVCGCNGEIIGYAYANTHRYRTAYQWSIESTVYIRAGYHRMGLARIMYNALFAILKLQGYYSVYAGVLAANVSSVAFHRAFGFEDIGLFKNIGYKLGEWHSNLWLQYCLQEYMSDPTQPIPIKTLMHTDAFRVILDKANEQLK